MTYHPNTMKVAHQDDKRWLSPSTMSELLGNLFWMATEMLVWEKDRYQIWDEKRWFRYDIIDQSTYGISWEKGRGQQEKKKRERVPKIWNGKKTETAVQSSKWHFFFCLTLTLPAADLSTETVFDSSDRPSGTAGVASNEVKTVLSLVELGVGAAAGLAGDVFDCEVFKY